MAEYLIDDGEGFKYVTPIIQSIGKTDANKIIQTDANGKIDNSLFGNNVIIDKENYYTKIQIDNKINKTIERLINFDGNTSSIITNNTFKNGTVKVYYNGLRELNFTEQSNNQIELGFKPITDNLNDEIIIEYEVDYEYNSN